MKSKARRRTTIPLATLAVLALALTGCSGQSNAGAVGTADGVVTISGSITDQNATLLEKWWAKWEKANHITINYTGGTDFEEQIGGNAQDLVLREDGAAVYDQWVAHKIPFSDARIKLAFGDADSLLLDPKYVNAGIGDASTISTSSNADVAKALESGACEMTHQPSDFVGSLKNADGSAATVSPTGDFWAFMLPPTSTATTPVTGGGDFVAAFSNDADTVKVQRYLASDAWAKSRVALGGVISPDRKLGATAASSPLLRESIGLLESPKTTFRFDASDLMPSIVGSGTFWTGMVQWANGTATPKVLSAIEASWPTVN